MASKSGDDRCNGCDGEREDENVGRVQAEEQCSWNGLMEASSCDKLMKDLTPNLHLVEVAEQEGLNGPMLR